MQKLEIINNKIHVIRNQKVMLDFDLAFLYQIDTKVLKQAVRRNIERFPEDFMFELTKEEFDNLRSQIVTSITEEQDICLLPLQSKVLPCYLLF